jgi:hypothetical protein
MAHDAEYGIFNGDNIQGIYIHNHILDYIVYIYTMMLYIYIYNYVIYIYVGQYNIGIFNAIYDQQNVRSHGLSWETPKLKCPHGKRIAYGYLT